RFNDEAHIDEVVVGRANSEFDIDMSRNWPTFINDFATAFRRQRSPANIISAAPPRDPSRPPFIAGNPAPAVIFEPDPATIVIGRPTEIFIRYPGPADIGVGPIAIRVRSPICIGGGISLPDITIIVHLVLATAVQIVIKKIYRDIRSARLECRQRER